MLLKRIWKFHDIQRDSCPDFPDSNSERDAILGLSPDAAQPIDTEHESDSSSRVCSISYVQNWMQLRTKKYHIKNETIVCFIQANSYTSHSYNLLVARVDIHRPKMLIIQFTKLILSKTTSHTRIIPVAKMVSSIFWRIFFCCFLAKSSAFCTKKC